MARKDKPHRLSTPSPRHSSISRSSSLLRMLSPTKDKMSTELRNALNLLGLRGFDALEEKFLKTDAFLRPWASFRDSFLLMQKGGSPVASEKGRIARTEILYYYTLFDEGDKRYDAIADEFSSQYTADEEKYGIIDKSFWGVEEHEKLLYVWLLQSFKVGKTRNPYDFEYFQCQNVCSAWEHVFVPIITAVRNDYCGKGRYHYGRLAKFVEDVSPSPLAFPNANIGEEMGQSYFQGATMFDRPGIGATDPVTNVLVRKKARKTFWGEDEQELRMVYAQYGQVVERPKVKISIEQWVQDQRKRVDYKKALEGLTGAEEPSVSHNNLNGFKFGVQPLADNVEGQPENQRSTSFALYGTLSREDSNYSNGSAIQPSPKKGHRRKSDGLYSSISSANPFSYDAIPLTPSLVEEEHGHRKDCSANLSVTAKPSPLEKLRNQQHAISKDQKQATGSSKPNVSDYDTSLEEHRHALWNGDTTRSDKMLHARVPSYEGTGYGNSPSMTSLPTVHESSVPGARLMARPSRIPSPSDVIAKDSPRKYHPIVEHAIARAEATPLVDGLPPMIPMKSPKRWSSARGHVHGSRPQQFVQEPSHGTLPRIISKDNIRAALGNISRESSEEQLQNGISPRHTSASSAISTGSVGQAFAGLGGRGMNTGEYTPPSKMTTYNSHMFPRVGSPAQGALHKRRYDPVEQYELEVLKRQIRGSDKTKDGIESAEN